MLTDEDIKELNVLEVMARITTECSELVDKNKEQYDFVDEILNALHDRDYSEAWRIQLEYVREEAEKLTYEELDKFFHKLIPGYSRFKIVDILIQKKKELEKNNENI